MTQIEDVLDMADLSLEIAEGYVNQRTHPEYPQLKILNYSEKAQYENHWTDTIKKCRGLIYNNETNEVLARPFAKFFNYGQDESVELDLDAPVYWVGDKADGSLGIAYRTPGGYIQIATRGSFESEQAIHASERLNYEDDADMKFLINQGHTPLYEIIYPENRIVLNYGERDELIFLGTVDMASGAYLPPDGAQPFWSINDVLSQSPRPNAEGYVIWTDPFTAIKLKQEDYLALHKIVTGLNRKAVWRALVDGSLDELMGQLPDEFFTWTRDVARELGDAYTILEDKVEYWYQCMTDQNFESRKDLALEVIAKVPADIRGLVFSQIDGKPVSDKIWKMLEPVGGEK